MSRYECICGKTFKSNHALGCHLGQMNRRNRSGHGLKVYKPTPPQAPRQAVSSVGRQRPTPPTSTEDTAPPSPDMLAYCPRCGCDLRAIRAAMAAASRATRRHG